MEVARLFQSAATQLSINIQGTPEEPLFQANQIGKLLGISKIRTSIEDFDDDEKVARTTGTLGGQQQTLFLTEVGLYRLLGQSRKPIARPFQKWVARTIKEIRINGKYELEQTQKQTARLLAQALENEEVLRKAAEHAKALEECHRREAEDAKAALRQKEEQLQKLKGKTYEEVPKHDNVYICKEVAELHSERHKIGMTTTKVKSRERQFNTGSAQGCKMIFSRKTSNAKIVEDMTHVILRRYNFSREHFQCRVDHSINVIDFACTVVDTLASSYECITREELGQKLIENLMNELSPQPDDDGGMPLFSQFVESHANKHDGRNDDSDEDGSDDDGSDDDDDQEEYLHHRNDPLLQLINETIDTRVNFNLERTDSLKGRRVLGFVRQRDLLDLIRAQDTTRVLSGVRVATLKDAVIRAMEARGTPLARTGCINGENVSNVFKGCSIVDDTVDE